MVCRRKKNWNLRKRYGITLDQFEEMLDNQGHLCAVCGTEMVNHGKYGNSAHVDHNHRTGQLRGLICCQCNHLLGKAKEDPRILLRAMIYLEKHAGTELI